MKALSFEWDPRKAVLNRKKHGVSFKEAESVFLDEDGLQIADPEHSDSEDRFILLGLSQHVRVLVVCHCFRAGDEVIRIISARKADARERAVYEKRRLR